MNDKYDVSLSRRSTVICATDDFDVQLIRLKEKFVEEQDSIRDEIGYSTNIDVTQLENFKSTAIYLDNHARHLRETFENQKVA
jgi:hypothetical protein